MKKKLLVMLVLGILIISCSSESEEYSIAADQLCKCMNESGSDLNDTSDLKLNIGVCLLDAKADLKDPQMLIQVEKKCPEIKEAFEEFIDDMEGN